MNKWIMAFGKDKRNGDVRAWK